MKQAELISNNTFNALIALLDDTDNEVISQVTNRLLMAGDTIIPSLKKAWHHNEDSLVQERINKIIDQIRFDNIKLHLKDWRNDNSEDLLSAVLLIAKYNHPYLDEKFVRHEIENLRIDAWLEMNYQLNPLEKIKVLNRILFEKFELKGNTKNYFHPDNSCINQVITTKVGSPILLSVIYLIIAKKLKMPVYGVNLPQHFILAYVDDMFKNPLDKDNKPLFYINPFNKGMIFSKVEIQQFLKYIKLEEEDRFFQPCSNLDIVTRILNNLIFAFSKRNDELKVKDLQELKDILNN